MVDKSSVKTSPNVRMLLTGEATGCFVHQGWSRILRGSLFVLVDSSMAGMRKPAWAPKRTRGTEMPNQSARKANNVLKGTAPEDFFHQMYR